MVQAKTLKFAFEINWPLALPPILGERRVWWIIKPMNPESDIVHTMVLHVMTAHWISNFYQKLCVSFIPYFRYLVFGHFSCVIFFPVIFYLDHLAFQNVNKDYIICLYQNSNSIIKMTLSICCWMKNQYWKLRLCIQT